MEDVNHEIYGGLYDQKIFGESFEEPVSMDNFIGFTVVKGCGNYKMANFPVQAHSGAKLVYDDTQLFRRNGRGRS